ncbi:MAG: glycosyltransferase family 4 protein [Pseudomonadota bacterium]
MRTLATLTPPGTFAGQERNSPLVGRMVANSAFLHALLLHGSFDDLFLFVGEDRDIDPLRAVMEAIGTGAPARNVRIANVFELPAVLAGGGISVIHLLSTTGFFDIAWLRDRYATEPVPVTAQIHSISYPGSIQEWLRGAILPASPRDAIVCSSTAGRDAIASMMRRLAGAAIGRLPAVTAAGDAAASVSAAVSAAASAPASTPASALPPLPCGLTVIPLGIDVDAVSGGDRARLRKKLSIPESAFVLLSVGRFTEYDKMDLFPLLQAFRGAISRTPPGDARPLFLVMAGARQGTRTPEMLQLWATALGINDRVRLVVDFPEGEKKDLLAAADLFVSPCDSPQETFGLAVVEAMAAGLPVVVSDYDGYKDTATEEVGIRVPTRACADLSELADLAILMYERPLHLMLGQNVEVDLAALEEAIVEMHQNERRRTAAAQNARRRARDLYAWPRVIASYEREWRRLAAMPSGRHERPARNPLSLDYDTAFANYPSERLSTERTVQRTPFAEEAIAKGGHPIYPELRYLISDPRVALVYQSSVEPVTIARLTSLLVDSDPQRPAWHAQYLIGWMLKHGMLGSPRGSVA